MQLPSVDPKPLKSFGEPIKHDEQVIFDSVANSYQGSLYEVSYTIHVFMKHDSWKEFGQGIFVSVPIRIV